MPPETLTQTHPEVTIIEKNPLFDLLIIGGGPAGLTAAIYAARFALRACIVEKMVLGGLASTAYMLENFPGFPDGILGTELGRKLELQAKKSGAEVVWGEAKSLQKKDAWFETEVDGSILKSKAIIIASGSFPSKLGVPGEEEFRGRGVSYCATCDGPFYKDKNIVVVGGGNGAIEEALFLSRYAKKISIVHRRDALRADRILVERAMANPKIYFFWHSQVEKISGSANVSTVTLLDMQSKKSTNVAAEGIFIYIGYQPSTSWIKELIKLDEKGYIPTNDHLETSFPGIFAAGDVRQKTLRQAITASSDGAVAADSARKFIENLPEN